MGTVVSHVVVTGEREGGGIGGDGGSWLKVVVGTVTVGEKISTMLGMKLLPGMAGALEERDPLEAEIVDVTSACVEGPVTKAAQLNNRNAVPEKWGYRK